MQQPILTAPSAQWRYDWADFTPGRKCLLLTAGGMLVVGQTDAGHRGYIAWSPMPERDKNVERGLGLR